MLYSLLNKIRNMLIYVVLSLISATLLFPLLYMFTNSLMSSREASEAYSAIMAVKQMGSRDVSAIGIKLIPDQVSLMQYYNVLLRKPRFLVMFWNSVFLTAPIVIGQMIVSTLAAFAFSKLRFPFRNKIFFVYIIVMMMPFQVTLVPNYLVLKRFNLIDTYLAVILPGIFTTFGVFLMKQFMAYIPDEYCEAAKIDGAGYIKVFFRIILPQCKGAMASLAILVFIDNWNMVEQPLIFLKDAGMHPLSIFMASINTGDIGVAFACGLIYMFPALLVFLYGENYFVKGIQLSGIK